jgi:hypothetical protein
MRKRTLVAAAAAGALAAGFLAFTHGSTAWPALLANSTQKGLPDSAYHNTWMSLPDPPLPTSGPPDICGPWSAANSAQVQAIRPAHGTLDSCLLVDHYWVVTTENGAGPAQIGILDCPPTDSTCMNGWQAKDLRTFAWHRAPPSVTQLKIVLVDGHLLTMITNYGQWTFDIDTAMFTRMTA